MTLKATLLTGAALVALSATANAAELRGTYVAFEGGGSWVDGERFFQDFIFSTSNYTYDEYRAEFDTGWAVMGSVGYAFGNHFRAELEAGYRRNKFDQLFDSSSDPISSEGELSEFSLMANLLYDIYLGKRLSLSVGAGAGADLAHLEVGAIGFEDEDWRFAYQGLVGLNYAIGERTQLFLNYRYLHVEAPEYITDLGGSPQVTQRLNFLDDLTKHAVTLGLRFALSGAEPTPPPPPYQAPPPPPPPPPEPKQFIVFFGFNKTNISAEAQRVIEDAAATAKQLGSASIIIVGHTDSSGSNEYNQALSERRSSSVRSALVNLGIADEKIEASGKGESELIVQTGDGVKEPQNRRATIDLK